MKFEYDFLIVGCGLFGSVFARQMTDYGKRCLIIDKRNHIGGNVYNENVGNLPVGQDPSVEVESITKQPLEKKLAVIDLSNPNIRSFINFATRFCYNAGSLSSGTYTSDDGKFKIQYVPVIKDLGVEQSTPARIVVDSGLLELSKKHFIVLVLELCNKI
jgi:hypothetical protein